MESRLLGKSSLSSSRLAYGCMRLAGNGSKEQRAQGKEAVRAAIGAGYTHFDHADIYGSGGSEAIFGEVLRERPDLRDSLLITSKCGIRVAGDGGEISPKRYDFSREHIIRSVEGSLSRLGVDYLDLLLLHRPDFLFDAGEVARTFEILHDAGKVREFGVSNFKPSQFSLLQSACGFPLIVNQLEINIDNMSVFHDGTLDQCQELGITPMAWCPLGGVAYRGWADTLTTGQDRRIEAELARQCERYDSEPANIVLAWLLKHPAGIVPIIGSTRPTRITAAVRSLDIDYAREDWYRLLEAREGLEVA